MKAELLSSLLMSALACFATVFSSHPALWDLLFCSPANVDNTRFDLTTGMTLICVAVSYTQSFFPFFHADEIFWCRSNRPFMSSHASNTPKKDDCLVTLKKPSPPKHHDYVCVVCPWSEVALGGSWHSGPGVVTRCYAVFQNGQSGLTSQWLDVSNDDLPCVSRGCVVPCLPALVLGSGLALGGNTSCLQSVSGIAQPSSITGRR